MAHQVDLPHGQDGQWPMKPGVTNAGAWWRAGSPSWAIWAILA